MIHPPSAQQEQVNRIWAQVFGLDRLVTEYLQTIPLPGRPAAEQRIRNLVADHAVLRVLLKLPAPEKPGQPATQSVNGLSNTPLQELPSS